MNFTTNNIWADVLIIAGMALALIVVSTFLSLLYRGIDRKLSARMQGRIGPPVVQPFRDTRKLLLKESITPEGAIPWLFSGAPLLAMISVAMLLLYLPLYGLPALLGGYGDVILILYLLIVPSLALVAGGFASSSPFATLGAQREMIVMMSYELPLVVVVLSIVWKVSQTTALNPFLLTTITANPVWDASGPVGLVGAAIMLLVLMVVTVGEAAKVPFDVAEAETEIAGGMLVEYSGRHLFLFYVADILKTFVMVSLIVALFFPYNISPVFGLGGIAAGLVDALFFLLKVLVVMFFSITLVRTVMARFKVSQVTKVYIVVMTGVALAGMLLLWIDTGFLG